MTDSQLKLAGIIAGTVLLLAGVAASYFKIDPAIVGLMLTSGGTMLGWVGLRRPGDVPPELPPSGGPQ